MRFRPRNSQVACIDNIVALNLRFFFHKFGLMFVGWSVADTCFRNHGAVGNKPKHHTSAELEISMGFNGES